VVGHQREKVQRLRKYCWDLDHTSLVCVEFENHTPVTHAGNAFHSQQAHSLHKAAEYMRGEPFIWLEPDSIPLQTGWVAALSHEYMKRGRSSSISSDSQKFDEVGGSGLSSGDELAPCQPTTRNRADLWPIQCAPPSPPHSAHPARYCIYPTGFCKDEHRFAGCWNAAARRSDLSP
jgi:hypothetical protein